MPMIAGAGELFYRCECCNKRTEGQAIPSEWLYVAIGHGDPALYGDGADLNYYFCSKPCLKEWLGRQSGDEDDIYNLRGHGS